MSVSSKDLRPDTRVILDTLARIFDSAPFRSGKQCQDLLRYVVEHSLRDDSEALKERVIGCEVFGRRPDYDTAEDPVVRIKAGDVRKRLALYYHAMPPDTHVELEMPVGSYRVEFRPFPRPGARQKAGESSRGMDDLPDSALLLEPRHNAPDPPAHSPALVSSAHDDQPVHPVQVESNRPHWLFKRRFQILTSLAVIVVLAVVSSRLLRPPMSPFEAFWAPIVSSRIPPVISVGSCGVYRHKYLEEYRKGSPHSDTDVVRWATMPRPAEQVNWNDMILDRTNFVGIGDAAAIASIGTTLSSFKKSYDLRFTNDLVFEDMRRSPTILIGAFSNSWTLELDDKLPFVFYESQYIREVAPPNRQWNTVRDGQGKATEDYALVSRIIHSNTGEFTLTIAGIDMTGMRASAEFVSDPGKLNQALKQLPAGWQGKNLQLLLHSRIIADVPSSTDVVESRVW